MGSHVSWEIFLSFDGNLLTSSGRNNRLDTKNPDKQLKLASESTGLQGKVEADGWHQAFTIAIQSVSSTATKSKRSTAKKGAGANKDGTKEETEKQVDGKNTGNSKETKSLIRRVSMSPFSRDGEDKASTMQMVVYGLVIVLLAVVVHYAWVHGYVSTKLYITLSALIAVLLAIFVQEFILVSNEPPVQTYTDATSKAVPPAPPQTPVTATPVRVSQIKTTAVFASPDASVAPKHTKLTFTDTDSEEGEPDDDDDPPESAVKAKARRPSIPSDADA